METILRNAERAAHGGGGEAEGEALLKALTRADKLPRLAQGRVIVREDKGIFRAAYRLSLTERSESLRRCWNCQGGIGKKRDVAIFAHNEFFFAFCCASCRAVSREQMRKQWGW